jgi:hypothetical protein
MFRPLRAILRRDTQLDTFNWLFLLQRIRCILHLQHRQHTSHEEETSNNRRKTKRLHCPQLDHHDADGLAGNKTWRTAQTTTRIFNILTFLYMRQLFFTENLLILQFHIYYFYIYIQLITCIRNTKSKYRCTTCNISASNCVRATDPL